MVKTSLIFPVALQTPASAITASRFAAALFFVKGQAYGLGG
ncbi:hypothetical protein [Acetobacter oeni]|nr:hypothetical protein [Acetobacter oeni]MBB3882218.1 hypothetical protein [Acetobacter oeni]